MLKTTLAFFFAATLLAPSLSFADPADSQLSRAEVRSHLSELEQAGYQPAGANINYPIELRKAQRKVSQNALNGEVTMTTAQAH